MLQISVKEIETELYAGFSGRYKAFGGFIDTEYWNGLYGGRAGCDAAVAYYLLQRHYEYPADPHLSARKAHRNAA